MATYLKLTKAQQKDRDRIEAWLRDEPFRENSKAKPAIPELSVEDVLKTYIPPSPGDTGAYYTPPKMAWEAHSHVPIFNGARVLDPCAGIGHLLYPLHDSPEVEVHAWELAQEPCRVGKHLFPQYNWIQDSAYEIIDQWDGYFDFVFMNPPYNIQWATSPYDSKLANPDVKSEHMFLEVALRALKPGGILYAIAPYNFIDKIPKKMSQWVHPRMNVSAIGKLDGEFRLTGIQVHGWYIERTEYEPAQGNRAKSTPVPPEPPASPPPPELPVALPKHAILLPIGVYEALRTLDPGDYMYSPAQVSKALRKLYAKDAADWIASHPIEYGIGFYNGFWAEGRPLLDLALQV